MKDLLFSLLFFFSTQVYSQQITKHLITSLGGEQSSPEMNVELSWSIGQIAGTILQSEQAIITQGFNQNELQTVPIYQWDNQDLNIEIYPNPFSERLIVRQEKITPLYIEIFDLLGNSVSSISCQGLKNEIALQHLPDQPFLVTIRSDSKFTGMRVVKISH